MLSKRNTLLRSSDLQVRRRVFRYCWYWWCVILSKAVAILYFAEYACCFAARIAGVLGAGQSDRSACWVSCVGDLESTVSQSCPWLETASQNISSAEPSSDKGESRENFGLWRDKQKAENYHGFSQYFLLSSENENRLTPHRLSRLSLIITQRSVIAGRCSRAP